MDDLRGHSVKELIQKCESLLKKSDELQSQMTEMIKIMRIARFMVKDHDEALYNDMCNLLHEIEEKSSMKKTGH